MNNKVLRTLILQEHSRAQAEKIASMVISQPILLKDLFSLFLANEYLVTQRAAYPLSIIHDKAPIILVPFYQILVDNLATENLHDAVKRNTLRIFEHVHLDESLEGKLVDICFKYLANPSEKVAIKGFSLTILGRITQKYPELKNELKMAIDREIAFQTPAFVNRAKKILLKR